MTLDELIETLTNIRQHKPGDTPVRMERTHYDDDLRFYFDVEEIVFEPSPKEGDKDRIVIR